MLIGVKPTLFGLGLGFGAKNWISRLGGVKFIEVLYGFGLRV